MSRFFPRFERMSTRVLGGTVQFYLHESTFDSPIPATRLSDGTIRFIAILAVLLAPNPPSFVCIEEPEFGLHPDAVAQVAELLIEASSRMQLVVTTHSESLVSALTERPDAVIVCERPGPGTTLHRLIPIRSGRGSRKAVSEISGGRAFSAPTRERHRDLSRGGGDALKTRRAFVAGWTASWGR